MLLVTWPAAVPAPACMFLPGAAVAALHLENSRLREEVDSLKRRLPALGLLRRTSSNMQLAGPANETLIAELAQVREPAGLLTDCQGVSKFTYALGLRGGDGHVEYLLTCTCV